MKLRLLLLFFCAITAMTMAQQKKSKADILFFEYAYKEAIVQYQKEAQKNPLSNQQQLNLADAYFKTQNYKNASNLYLSVYKKDTTMSTHHFNKMLQSFSKDSNKERVQAFLETKKNVLSNELLENAAFNYELLATKNQETVDFEIFNINGNSEQADFSPAFYKDRLLFTTARAKNVKAIYGPSGESYLDIYIGALRADGDVLSATPFTKIPNADFHEGTPFYAADVDKVFYIRSNTDEDGELAFSPNGKNALGIGMASRDANFQFLLRDLNTSFYYPFYEEATGKLYFAANFDDSYGGTDIYYVYTNKGQIMSAPVNLGPKINSPANEISPFIFENSLYFASDVFYGLGGMDIYKTNIQPSDTYSIPVNLGPKINSSADDFGFIIKNKDEGLLGYFSSNRAGGKGNDDIYGFNVAEKPGLKTIVLQGEIRNSVSGQTVSKVAIRIYDNAKNLIKEVYSDEEGGYQIEVPGRDTIAVEITKDRYSRFYTVYDKEAVQKIQETAFNINIVEIDDLVERTEGQTVFKLKKFYFKRGGWNMTAEVATELDKVVDAVKKFPEVQLRIESHTDSRGGSSTNFKLSQRRSDTIKKYLVEHGVPESAILYSIGYGEDKIVNTCKNGRYCIELLHKQNERSLVVILNYDLLFQGF